MYNFGQIFLFMIGEVFVRLGTTLYKTIPHYILRHTPISFMAAVTLAPEVNHWLSGEALEKVSEEEGAHKDSPGIILNKYNHNNINNVENLNLQVSSIFLCQ